MFGLRRRIKELENRMQEVESKNTANSFLYGKVTLQDVVKIIEKTPPEYPTVKRN